MITAIRKHSQKYVKVYCWTTCDAASFYFLSGSFGANKDNKMRQRIEAEAARSGKSFDDVAQEVRVSASVSIFTRPNVTSRCYILWLAVWFASQESHHYMTMKCVLKT